MSWQDDHHQARQAAGDRQDKKALTLWERALKSLGTGSETAADRMVVHDAMARHHAQRGRFDASIEAWEAVARDAAMAGGPHKVSVARAYCEVADILVALDRLEEAEGYLREALKIWEFHLGDSHVETANTLKSLGYLLRDTGKFAEAEACLRRAHAFYSRRFSQSCIEVPRLLDAIATLLAMQEKYEEAGKVFNELFHIWRHSTNSKRPDMIKSVNDLAAFFLASGRLDKAERACERALELSNDLWGEDNQQAVRSLNILGVCRSRQRRFDEAQQCFEQALGMAEKVHGLHHRITAEILDNLTALTTSRLLRK